MSDAVIAVLIVAGLVGAFALAGLPWWAAFWGALAALLGLFEALARWKTGKTLSQQFWAFHAQNKALARGLAGVVGVGGLGLMVHLLWR